MRLLSCTLTVVIALISIGACVGCTSGVAKLSDADVAAIRSATQRYVKMDEARNPEVLQFIAEDAVFMPPGIAPLQGRKAIEELFKAHPWENLSENLGEAGGRGDLAFARGMWSIMYKGAPVTGSYIEIWQKRPDGAWQINGAWQIVRKVWNTE
jgi:ketosteroid isomerase-like protein